MKKVADYRVMGCSECMNGTGVGFDFSMALQPIVDVTSGEVFAQEALARGLNGEPAATVFAQVNETNLYRFDQTCRVKAVKLASDLQIPSRLSINFMPNAVYQPELCIRTTLAAAETYKFPVERIIFEFTESEQVRDISHLKSIVKHYQERGFLTALDDFGAGYAGLSLLADIYVDLVKLDMALIRGLDRDSRRAKIVKAAVQLCNDLGVQVIAEGVETREEYQFLMEMGVVLFQGFYFARPAFEALADIDPLVF